MSSLVEFEVYSVVMRVIEGKRHGSVGLLEGTFRTLIQAVDFAANEPDCVKNGGFIHRVEKSVVAEWGAGGSYDPAKDSDEPLKGG